MIEECAINMECKLIDTLETKSHDIFIGEIISTYCDDKILVGDKINLSKIKPLLYSMADRGYWSIGTRLFNAWDIGNKLIKN